MDYHRLMSGAMRLLYIPLFALMISCAKNPDSAKGPSNVPPSILETALNPKRAFLLSDHFLEYQKGYRVRVRDLDRGLLVTDWSSEGGADRHQVTLRVTTEAQGALISAHIRTEALEGGKWKDLPTLGSLEAHFLKDLNLYLQSHAKP